MKILANNDKNKKRQWLFTIHPLSGPSWHGDISFISLIIPLEHRQHGAHILPRFDIRGPGT